MDSLAGDCMTGKHGCFPQTSPKLPYTLSTRHTTGHAVRPDIEALGENGVIDYYDVSAINPLTPESHPFFAICQVESLNNYRLGKETRLAELIRTKGPGYRFIFISFSTFWGWHLAAPIFTKRVATSIAARAIRKQEKVYYS